MCVTIMNFFKNICLPRFSSYLAQQHQISKLSSSLRFPIYVVSSYQQIIFMRNLYRWLRPFILSVVLLLRQYTETLELRRGVCSSSFTERNFSIVDSNPKKCFHNSAIVAINARWFADMPFITSTTNLQNISILFQRL